MFFYKFVLDIFFLAETQQFRHYLFIAWGPDLEPRSIERVLATIWIVATGIQPGPRCGLFSWGCAPVCRQSGPCDPMDGAPVPRRPGPEISAPRHGSSLGPRGGSAGGSPDRRGRFAGLRAGCGSVRRWIAGGVRAKTVARRSRRRPHLRGRLPGLPGDGRAPGPRGCGARSVSGCRRRPATRFRFSVVARVLGFVPWDQSARPCCVPP